MSTDPAQRTRSRTLSSRTNLEKDMELLRRYSNRYLPQGATAATGSYRPGQISNYTSTGSSQFNTYARPSMTNMYGTVGSGGNKATPSRSQYGGDSVMNMSSLNSWDSSISSNQELSDTMRMVDSMQSRANEQLGLLSKMEELALQSTTFGKHENADKWSTLEVCYWLNSIHMHKYIPNFSSLSIDGSILLHDLDENMLVTELGIKKIHLKKCIREIIKLKEAVQSREKGVQVDKSRRIEELERQVASLHQTNLKLKEHLQSLNDRMKQLTSSSPRSQSSQDSSNLPNKNNKNKNEANENKKSENDSDNDSTNSNKKDTTSKSSATKTNESDGNKS